MFITYIVMVSHIHPYTHTCTINYFTQISVRNDRNDQDLIRGLLTDLHEQIEMKHPHLPRDQTPHQLRLSGVPGVHHRRKPQDMAKMTIK